MWVFLSWVFKALPKNSSQRRSSKTIKNMTLYRLPDCSPTRGFGWIELAREGGWGQKGTLILEEVSSGRSPDRPGCPLPGGFWESNVYFSVCLLDPRNRNGLELFLNETGVKGWTLMLRELGWGRTLSPGEGGGMCIPGAVNLFQTIQPARF